MCADTEASVGLADSKQTVYLHSPQRNRASKKVTFMTTKIFGLLAIAFWLAAMATVGIANLIGVGHFWPFPVIIAFLGLMIVCGVIHQVRRRG